MGLKNLKSILENLRGRGLTIMIGSPGAGKSSIIEILEDEGRIGRRINPDPFVINMAKLAGLPFSEYLEKDREYIRQLITESISEGEHQKESIILESVLVKSLYEIAKEKGMSPINIVYVDADPELCKKRVKQREFFEEGISFSDDQIDKMVQQSRNELISFLDKADCVLVIDNSRIQPKVVFEVVGGIVTREAKNLPEWLKNGSRHLMRDKIALYKKNLHPKITKTCRFLLTRDLSLRKPHMILLLDDRIVFPKLTSPVDYDKLIQYYRQYTKNKGDVLKYPTLENLGLRKSLPEEKVLELVQNRIGTRRSFVMTNEFHNIAREVIDSAKEHGYEIATFFFTDKNPTYASMIKEEFFDKNAYSYNFRGLSNILNILRKTHYGYIYCGSTLVEGIYEGQRVYQYKNHPLREVFDDLGPVVNDSWRRPDKFTHLIRRSNDPDRGRIPIHVLFDDIRYMITREGIIIDRNAPARLESRKREKDRER